MKTNYVEKEIKKLEKYVKQLETYLDNNPADKIRDRIDTQFNSRTGVPTSKVVASQETQLKAFVDTIQKLPKLIDDLNNLRRSVADKKEEVKEARGNVGIPSYMQKIKSEEKKEEEKEEDSDNW